MEYLLKNRNRLLLFVLLLALAAHLAAAPAVCAQEAGQKVVRVGWYETPLCYRDRFGRQCGLDYEYQNKISTYTGWKYEYVEDSWPNLLQKLMAGEIDLLSDVSYTEARAASMLFPSLPMGAESYYIYINVSNKTINPENPASFNGKRIGVNQGSIQEIFLREWAQKNHVALDVVLLMTEEGEALDMVAKGKLDGYATITILGFKEDLVPVCKIGSSNFYYAVNKNRPDLFAELNRALEAIQEDEPYFSQKIQDSAVSISRPATFLSQSQMEWLWKHGTIRVGYLDNFFPFCAKDPETGELTGALKEYLDYAAEDLHHSNVRFEAVPYPTTEAALEAMRRDEVDCVFPIHLSTFDASGKDMWLTNPAMKTAMHAVMRVSGQHRHLAKDAELLFAFYSGDTNIENFIKDYYPMSRPKFYPDRDSCFEAVSSGEVDCTLVSNYRLDDIGALMEKYSLFSVPTGEAMPLSFAVNKADRELYFILNKAINLTKSKDMDSALAAYAHANRKMTFTQFLREHWLAVLSVLTAVFLVIIFLLLKKLKAERKANEQQRMLEEAAKVAELKRSLSSLLNHLPGLTFSKDAKTGVYLACNQAFADYAQKPDPEKVVGCTDAELFDETTVRSFVENDRKVLASEEPRVYFEEVSDPAGNLKQFQTTKLKYTDDEGRLCILGICQDLTDTVRIQRENEATKEAYEKVRNTNVIFTHIAKTLARGYSDFYYVNLDTGVFIEYRADEESGEIAETRRGENFFTEVKVDIARLIHPDDRAAVEKLLNRENLQEALDREGAIMLPYRILSDHGASYLNMRVSRMDDDDRFVIIGVTDIDEQVKRQQAEEQMKEERMAFSRVNALAGDYICIYVVDPETERYVEYSATSQFDSFEIPKEGTDFFKNASKNSRRAVHPDDLERALTTFTKENVLATIEQLGLFTMTYRLMIDGKPTYARLKAAMVEEPEGRRLIVGINDVDNQIRQEEEYAKRLANAQREANIDALTGVKNRHAYLETEEHLDRQIAEHLVSEFAIVILDVNDLKEINDTQGHHAGDEHIRGACKVICNIFKRSPVFRVGGDEFAVVAQGSDYQSIEELIGKMSDYNANATRTGGIVIACGMAKFDKDPCTAPVFERADQNMYVNKSNLKAAKNNRMG